MGKKKTGGGGGDGADAAPTAAAPTEPKAKAEPTPKAKAEPKPKAKAEPTPKAKAEPAPKAKAEAKAKAEPKAKAKAEAKSGGYPEPEAKAEAKAKPKAKEQPKKKAEPPKKIVEEVVTKVEIVQPFEMLASEGAMGDDWECVSGDSKKKQNKKKREEEAKEMAKEMGKPAVNQQGKAIPGAIFVEEPKKGEAKKKGEKEPTALQAAEQAAEQTKKEPDTSDTVEVPEKKIGIVIGPKGARLKLIQEKTKVARIDTSGEIFTIFGQPNNVRAAKLAILELVEHGYLSLEHENFLTNTVLVSASTIPLLIGPKGAIVIKLKDDLSVNVNFPDTTGIAKDKMWKKVKVSVAGNAENVEKATKAINDIALYGYSEVTHPGFMHEEVEVPWECLHVIIGKGGSQIKHIQKNYEVNVNTNWEAEVFASGVLVCGEPRNVERAKACIVKMLATYNERPQGGRGSADKAEDYWGNKGGKDDEEEPWMKEYLYKRK